MAAQTPVNVGTLLVVEPGVQGGVLCLAGTRVRVRTIAHRYGSGESPEYIAEDMGGLPLSHVHAAIAYYLANRELVDAELAEEDAEHDRLAAESLKQRRTG